MERDPRYNTVKIMIEGGHVTEFRQIFDKEYIPKTTVATDMGTNYKRLVRLIDDVTQFKVGDIVTVAGFFDVDTRVLFNLIANQIGSDKKPKKKERDPRYNTVKILIEGGHLAELKQIFANIPKTIVAADMGENQYKRLVRSVKDVTRLFVSDIVTLASFFEVDKRAIFNLVANQIDNKKKARRKR